MEISHSGDQKAIFSFLQNKARGIEGKSLIFTVEEQLSFSMTVKLKAS